SSDSHSASKPDPTFGPFNDNVRVGSGTNGARLEPADGTFSRSSRSRITDVTDGTLKTAMMSESLLGAPQVSSPPHPPINDNRNVSTLGSAPPVPFPTPTAPLRSEFASIRIPDGQTP